MFSVKRFIAFLFAIAIIMMWSTQSFVQAVENEQLSRVRLNLMFVIDVSNTHYSVERNRDADIFSILDSGGSPRVNPRRTDPTNIRFDALSSLLHWLAQNESQLSIDIKINVVTFAAAAAEWENSWQSLSVFAQPDFNLPKPDTTADSTADATANLVNMMTSLPNFMSGRLPMTNNDAVIFLITDSVPCESRSACLREKREFVNRARQDLTVPNNTILHILFTPFTDNVSGFWDIFGDLRQAYVDLAEGSGGTFVDFDNIEKMPSVLAQLVLAEIGRAKGKLSLSAGERLDTQTLSLLNWSDLIPNLARMGQVGFEIPPYQSKAHFWVALNRNTLSASYSPPRFFINNISSNPYDTDTPWELLGNTYQQQLARPPHLVLYPASTNYNSDGFVFYTPARAEARIEPINGDVIRQYEQARLVYQIRDQAGVAFIQDELPNISATVRVGSSQFVLDEFDVVTIRNEEPALYSQPFFVQSDQRYTVQINARPQPNWTTSVAYNFLNPPDNQVTFTPKTMRFVARIGDNTPQTNLSVPQDTSIPIVVSAEVDGRPYPLPDNVTARLVTQPQPNRDDACTLVRPQNPVFIPDLDNDRRVLKTSLEFDGAGTCELSVALTFESVIYPIEGQFAVPPSESLKRIVDVSPATRITIAEFEPEYRMNNYQARLEDSIRDLSQTLAWALQNQDAPFANDELTLTVQLVTENGNDLLTPLAFANDARFPDRSHCPQEVRNQPVPFNLEILDRDNNDKARPLGICLTVTDKSGVYLTKINRLAAGDYTLRITLDANAARLDNSKYNYVDDIQTTNNGLFVASFPLIVDDATSMFRFIVLIVAAFGVVSVAIAILFLLQRLLIKTYLSRRNPLTGTVSLWVQKGDGSPSLIWQKDLPRKHTTTFREFDNTIEMFRLGLGELSITTNKRADISKAGGAHVKLQSEHGLYESELVSGDMRRIVAIDDYTYYIAKDIDPNAPTQQNQRLTSISDTRW